ncbi:MAG: malto-oligosyltrehalose synthase [Nocardioidaceae bacterium]|nr:malto-oligosyltrehalose synthase [Nocardioidaceae bacterium]
MGERPLSSTYRLQLHAGFAFADAENVVPYLAELGVSHLYLSPILQAAPGSMHGYDVVDHGRISDDLGGESALLSLASTAHAHDVGIVCDVVPNHMCIPEPEHLNHQLWDVLRNGRGAASAAWFDIDWELGGGRLGLPVLGASLAEVIDAGELVLDQVQTRDGNEAVLRYHGHVFPVADGTGRGNVASVARRQHYLLGSWREKRSLLSHRRFFDVDTLIALRVEDPEVFDRTHALLLDLHGRGVLDGFRIDHPDGLANPEAYLARLAEATDGAWVVVEKILEGDERLPTSWATAGSTGYDAINVIQAALAPRTSGQLDCLWQTVGGKESLPEVELGAKRLVLSDLLEPEVERLLRLVRHAADDAGVKAGTDGDLRTALSELLTRVKVYRAYLRPGPPADPGALDRFARLVQEAQDACPDLSAALDLLHRLLTDVDSPSAAGRELVIRFQQVCGSVMAKGVEDTAFYRYNRLVALNEVGGDPSALDFPGPQRLHDWASYQQQQFPLGMTTLSTHDTKRNEDVRARLLAVAGDPDAWTALWDAVQRHASSCHVDGPTAYLVFQTLLGAWPIDADRLQPYVEKAIREAKQHTTWQDPEAAYEQLVHTFVAACLNDGALSARLTATVDEHAAAVGEQTLAAKLLQLTLPGVPDVYQGCEAVALSLVDPDNRRPVDFDALRARLRRLDQRGAAGWSVGCPAGWAAADLDDAKLWVTRQALRLRRQQPDLFGADAAYAALPSSDEVVAFVRSHGDRRVVTAVRVHHGEATLALPDATWRDVLTDAVRTQGADVFATLPVALLLQEDR